MIPLHFVATFGALALLASCSSPPMIAHPERFYLQEPGALAFTYERTFGDEGVIQGTMTLEVEEVVPDRNGTYSFAGKVSQTTRGHLTSRDAAQAAPREVVQAAMEPDNVAEVFEEASSQPGVRIIRIHWDRLRTLRLPLEYDDEMSPAPFRSSLRTEALPHAAEVALVWHKVYAHLFSIMPFGEYSAADVEETADALALTLTQRLPNGSALRFRYRFAAGEGLVGVETKLEDGSALVIQRRR